MDCWIFRDHRAFVGTTILASQQQIFFQNTFANSTPRLKSNLFMAPLKKLDGTQRCSEKFDVSTAVILN